MSVVAMTAMTDRLAMTIESLVDYMGVSTGAGERSLIRYDRALPFMPEVLDALGGGDGSEAKTATEEARTEGEGSGRATRLIGMFQTLKPSVGLDVSWLCTTGGGANSSYKWAANRIRRVDPKHCRGATLIAPLMAEMHVAIVKRDATYQEAKFFVAWMNGRWRFASRRHQIPTIERQTEESAGLGVWLQSEIAQGWQAILGYEGAPRIRFGTSAEGVLECFRLRDLPNGKTRRAALVHWVEKHWRRTGKTVDEEHVLTEVRRHLRGVRSFVWNGLSCEIVPASYEFQPSASAQTGGAR